MEFEMRDSQGVEIHCHGPEAYEPCYRFSMDLNMIWVLLTNRGWKIED